MAEIVALATPVLYSIVVIIAVLLIGLVLLQPSKSGGIGAAFGGVGESVFGAQTLSHLSKLTIVLMSVFFALTLLLAILSGHKQKSKSLLEADATLSAPVKTEAPAKAAAPASLPAQNPAPAQAKP